MNALMITGALLKRRQSLFSKLKLVTDNLPYHLWQYAQQFLASHILYAHFALAFMLWRSEDAEVINQG